MREVELLRRGLTKRLQVHVGLAIAVNGVGELAAVWGENVGAGIPLRVSESGFVFCPEVKQGNVVVAAFFARGEQQQIAVRADGAALDEDVTLMGSQFLRAPAQQIDAPGAGISETRVEADGENGLAVTGEIDDPPVVVKSFFLLG